MRKVTRSALFVIIAMTLTSTTKARDITHLAPAAPFSIERPEISTGDSLGKVARPHATANLDTTLRAKIGQMIMIGFPGVNPGEDWPARIAKMIRDGQIGGVVLYSQNVVDPRQLKSL